MSCKLVLSLDGGGIRGNFDVEILHLIESKFNKKIADIFDLVVGVSVGSITAALISTKRYDDIRSIFLDDNQLLGNEQALGPLFESKYDGTSKTAFLNRIYGEMKLGAIKYPLAVLTSTVRGDPELFTSWNPEHADISLVDVLDASTAVPIYFPPVEIKGKWYIDGGTISNDPVLAAISMVKKKWGEKVNIKVLSIGAGPRHLPGIDIYNNKKFGLLRWLKEDLVNILTRSNTLLYREIIPQIIGKGNYIRVSSTIPVTFDDKSVETQSVLTHHARDIWKEHGDHIISWMKTSKCRSSKLK